LSDGELDRGCCVWAYGLAAGSVDMLRMLYEARSAQIAHSFVGNDQYFPLLVEGAVEGVTEEIPAFSRILEGRSAFHKCLTPRLIERELMIGSKNIKNSVNECQTI